MPQRINKKLLLIIIGSMLVMALAVTALVIWRTGSGKRIEGFKEEAEQKLLEGKTQDAVFIWEKVLDRQPDDVVTGAKLATAYEDQKRLDKALTAWNNVLYYEPNNLEAWTHVARFRSLQQRWGDLERAADKIIGISPQNARGHYYKALACFGQGPDRVIDAMEHAKLAVQYDPQDVDARLTLARVHMMRNADDEVLRALTEGLKAVPDSQELWSFLGTYHSNHARQMFAAGDRENSARERDKAETAYKAALEHATDVVEAHLELARFYHVNQRKEDAVRHHSEATKTAESPADRLKAYQSFGDYHRVERDWENALKQYDEALVAWPNRRDVLIAKAQIYLTTSRPEEARRAIDEVKKQGVRDRWLITAMYLDSFRLTAAGRVDESIAELEEALNIAREGMIRIDGTDLLLALARAYEMRDDSAKAVAILEQAYDRAPQATRVLQELARLRFARREYDEVIKLLKDESRRSFTGHLMLVRAYMARGTDEDLRLANEQLTALARARTDRVEIPLEQGRLAARNGKYDEAVTFFDKAIELKSDYVQAWLAKAVTHRLAKKPALAEKAYLDAIKALPGSPTMRYELARHYDRQGQFEKGEEVLRKAILSAPDDGAERKTYERYLPQYYLAGGHVDEALAFYRAKAAADAKDVETRQTIVQLDLTRQEMDDARKYIDEIKAIEGPLSPRVMRLEGQHLVYEGKYPEALVRLIEAQKTFQNDADVLYYLGLCYLRTGDARNAQDCMERVAQKLPNNPRVQRALAEIYYTRGNLQKTRELVGQLRSAGLTGMAIDIMEAESLTRTDEAAEGEKVWLTITKKHPDRPEGWIGLMDALTRQGKLTEAIEAGKKAYTLDKKSFRTTVSLANLYIAEKKVDEAIEVAKGSLTENPENLALRGLLARLYDISGKPDDAAREYAKIRQLDPTNPLPAIAAADHALVKQDLPGAEANFRDALRMRPENRVVRLRLVEVLMAQRTPEKVHDAHVVIDDALRTEPNDIDWTALKARVYRAEGKFNDTIRCFNDAIRLAAQTGRERAAYVFHFELGRLYYDLGQLLQARRSLETARDLRPDFVEGRLWLVEVYRRRGLNVDARVECLKILEFGPQLRAYLTLGDIAAGEKNWREAMKHYDDVVKHYPNDPTAYRQRGQVYLLRSMPNEAEAEFRTMIEKDDWHPRSVAVLVGMMVGDKRFDGALKLCREGLLKTKFPAAVQQLMGGIEAGREHWADARKYFDQALETQPKNASLYLAKAKTFWAEKKADEAIAEARRTLGIDPGHEEAYGLMQAIYTSENRPADLDVMYRDWVMKQPDSIVAVNNYAWHLCETADKPLEASQLIEALRTRYERSGRPMQHSAELDDTEGRIAFKLGKYREAVTLFTRSLETRPDSARTWEHLRQTHVKLMNEAKENRDEPAERRYEYETRKAFAKVRELSPGNFDMQVQLGDLKLQEGQFREAITAYEQALHIKKDRPTQRKLAELLIRDGRTDKAEPLIEELVKDEPEEPRNHILKGYFLSRTGKSDEAVTVLEAVTKSHPEILMGHYILGLERINRGELAEGRKQVDATIAIDPNFAGARLVRAGLLAAEGKIEQAVAECDEVLKKDPMHFDAMYEKARFLVNARRLPDAIAVYRDMKTRWPDSVAVQELLAQAYLAGGQASRALVEYEEARRRNPDSTRVLRGLATVLKAQNNVDRAVAEYKTFLEDNPLATIAWVELGDLYESQRQWGQAENAYKEAVRTAATNIPVHSKLVSFYMSRKMYPEAASAGRRILREIPSKAGQVSGYLVMADVYQAQGQLDQAEENYRNALSADEGNLQLRNMFAQFHMANRKYDEAAGVGSDIVKRASSNGERAVGCLVMARAFEAKGDLVQAEANYRKALEAEPNHAIAANGWAWMLLTRKKDYAGAVRVAEPFLDKWKGFPELYDTVGWAYALDGKNTKAEETLRHCVNVVIQQMQARRRGMDPAAATMFYHCAVVLNTNGKTDEAKKLLEAVQQVDFAESQEAKKLYEKIK